MLKSAGFHPLMYDPESFIYHEGPTKGTCTTLDEIVKKLQTVEPNSPGHPPHGYALMVRHVDDKVMIVTDPKITEYMVGHVRNTYACTYTGWKKVLGWDAVIDRDERTVAFECPSVLEAAKNRFLRDSSIITPRHIMTPSLMDLELGEVPPEGHPDRASMLAMQAEGASLLGLMIWITERYPQGLFVTRWVGRKSHSMSWDGYRFLKFALMHLLAHPYATHWGGEKCRSLELSSPIKQPHSDEGQEWGMYAMADANVGHPKSMTGVVVMLAGGQVDSVCQSQQCVAGESHTTEVVAGGTALNRIIPARGTLQEMHCPQERATPCYFDSATTIFVSNDDAAVKRALWLRRRVAVLRAGVEDQEFEPMKIPEADNAPDMFTKYLAYPVWHKHATFINNMTPAREKKASERQAEHRSVKHVAPPPSPPPSPPNEPRGLPPTASQKRRARRTKVRSKMKAMWANDVAYGALDLIPEQCRADMVGLANASAQLLQNAWRYARRARETLRLSLAFTRWMRYARDGNRWTRHWTQWTNTWVDGEWVRPDWYDSGVELDLHNAPLSDDHAIWAEAAQDGFEKHVMRVHLEAACPECAQADMYTMLDQAAHDKLGMSMKPAHMHCHACGMTARSEHDGTCSGCNAKDSTALLDTFRSTYGTAMDPTGTAWLRDATVVDLTQEQAEPPFVEMEAPPTRTCMASAWDAITQWWTTPIVGASASSFNLQEILRYPMTGWLASHYRLSAMSDATARRSNGLPSDKEVEQIEEAVAWHA